MSQPGSLLSKPHCTVGSQVAKPNKCFYQNKGGFYGVLYALYAHMQYCSADLIFQEMYPR